MPNLAIDNLRIEAKPGETILQAARAAGIEIPTLCHLEGFEAGASCMVCAVKQSMMTSQNGVVAAGRAIRPELKPVGSVVEGKVVDAEMRDFIPDAGTSATMFSDRRS